MTTISIGPDTFGTVGQLPSQQGAKDATGAVMAFGYGYGRTPGQIGVSFVGAAAQTAALSYGAASTVTLGTVTQSERGGAGYSASDGHNHPYVNAPGTATPDPLAGTDEAGKTYYSKASSVPSAYPVFTGPPNPATTQLFGWYSQYEGTGYSGTVAPDNTILSGTAANPSGNGDLDIPLSFTVTDGAASAPLSFLATLGRYNGSTPSGSTGTVTIQHGYLADPDVDYRLDLGSQTVKFANGDSLKVRFNQVALANNPDAAALTASFVLSGLSAYGIAATDAAKARPGSGTAPFTFTVTRTGDISAAATLTYAVTGSGSAPATASDFAGGALPSGSVGFVAGAPTGADAFFGGTGACTFLLGSGNDLVGTGTGTSTVQLGSGKDTVFAFGTSAVTAGTGSADIVMGGAVQLNLARQAAGAAARTFALFNFVPGTDRISLSGYDPGAAASAVTTQGNSGGYATLTLPDSTTILLLGTAHAGAGAFG